MSSEVKRPVSKRLWRETARCQGSAPLSTLQMSLKNTNSKQPEDLLKNIHEGLKAPKSEVFCVQGDYHFYHYGVSGQDDRGWGCGYRTLQSLCSWVKIQHLGTLCGRIPKPVPDIHQIQEALVAMGDKDEDFTGSKSWIGSFEVPCKILHAQSGQDLPMYIGDIVKHFQTFGSPVMMGGDMDSSSKGILGVSSDPDALLVMDPHYFGNGPVTREHLQEHGWIKWMDMEEFLTHSFYNLCLPQLKALQLS